MKINIYKPDYTFKLYFLNNIKIKNTVINIIYDIQKISLKPDDVLILSPQENSNVDDEIFNLISKSTKILNFENKLPLKLHELFDIKNYTLTTPLKSILDYLLKIETTSQNDKTITSQDRSIDHDLSRGFIHDINNKLFPPLTVINSLMKILEDDSKEINFKKINKMARMAKKSLDASHDISLSYRKLFLSPHEVKDLETANLVEIISEYYNLIKYKSSKATVDIKLENNHNEDTKLNIKTNPVLLLQLITASTCVFLNKKRSASSFPLNSIVIKTSEAKTKIALLIQLNSDQRKSELVNFTNSDEFKNIFLQHQDCIKALRGLSFRLLEFDSSIGLYYEVRKCFSIDESSNM